jgi:hypothetical protein
LADFQEKFLTGFVSKNRNRIEVFQLEKLNSDLKDSKCRIPARLPVAVREWSEHNLLA